MTNINRRRFLGGLLLIAAAPMVVKAASLMPARAIVPTLWGDGIHDDTRALQALVDGERVYDVRLGAERPARRAGEGASLIGGVYVLSTSVDLSKARGVWLNDCTFRPVGEHWNQVAPEPAIFDFVGSRYGMNS